MTRRLMLRVIAPPLNHAHLIDLLQGYEGSGFEQFDPRTARDNDLAIARAGNPFGPDDVFVDGPLAGRRIGSVSLRMQTYALAPSIEMLPGAEAIMTEDFADLVGKPLVVSSALRRTIIDEHQRLELETDAIDSFLSHHHGLTAAMGSE